MNLDIGSGWHFSHYLNVDALHIDVQKAENVNVVCDALNLPFRSKVFRTTFMFHILEHLPNPIKALREAIRVTKQCLEIEIPHRLSSDAKQKPLSHRFDEHLWSFKTSWFHGVLRNYRHHLKVFYRFPRKFHIHVWIYL